MTSAALGVSRPTGIEKAPGAFRTIREVSEELGVPQHVLRFWESRFGQVRPLKRAGGRRYYRPEDVELLRRIQRLLYQDGYTIRGVQKLFRDSGAKALRSATAGPAAPSRDAQVAQMAMTNVVPPAVARPSEPIMPRAEASKSLARPDDGDVPARLETLASELEGILALLRG